MKKRILLLSAVIISAIAFTACSKKDTADNYVTEQNDIMNKMQEEMDKVQDTGNATLDFLYGMKSYLKYAKEKKDPAFKEMAEEIIKTQEEEIEEMKEMAKAIETDKELDYEDEQSYLKEYHSMMKDHDMSHNMVTSDVDTAFAEGMMVHHQMAVDMAESILKYTNNEEVIEFAKNIVETQNEEIAEMQSFLDEHADNKNHSH